MANIVETNYTQIARQGTEQVTHMSLIQMRIIKTNGKFC